VGVLQVHVFDQGGDFLMSGLSVVNDKWIGFLIRDEYAYLVQRFTINDRDFGRIILEITEHFSTEVQLSEVVPSFEISFKLNR
jgi:hypothetical protein